MSDISDAYAEANQGKSNTGFYQGIAGICFIVSSVAQGVISGFVMSATGYDSTLSTQSDTAILGINVMALFTPAFFMILSGLSMTGFQIKRKAKKV